MAIDPETPPPIGDGGEVSCRLAHPLFAILTRTGADIEAVAARADIDLAHVRVPQHWMSWAAAMGLATRTAEQVGGANALEEAMVDHITRCLRGSEPPPASIVAWASSQHFSMRRWHMRAQGDAFDMEVCPQPLQSPLNIHFIRLAVGTLRALPAIAGLPHARVTTRAMADGTVLRTHDSDPSIIEAILRVMRTPRPAWKRTDDGWRWTPVR